ncbi:Hypothetical predicted protein [Mytilus galloprovincialis]|uniref:Reverse transcriptase domain-containing protein n=1 Tax=Mytilus galloprovincialis TaxID=29158 RepID=A0A8B6CS60_MYTGA|nr:Hypothetical predicted protein [Mytilus galloprovincialis]
MYNGVTSTVKWQHEQGDTSLSFSIDQGVRQGGILSSHLYKQYINELLSELETHNMGISIGNTYAGCPSCADDATSAVYLLLGALPITAELHKRQLSLLHSIAMSHNNSIREIAWRQHTAGRPNSFFKRINDILDMYQLPSFNEIMNQHYNKLDWKNIVRTAISSHWTVKLKADCEEKSTLKLLSKRHLNIGQNHNVWDTISSELRQRC